MSINKTRGSVEILYLRDLELVMFKEHIKHWISEPRQTIFHQQVGSLSTYFVGYNTTTLN